jgi:hypothetical protein
MTFSLFVDIFIFIFIIIIREKERERVREIEHAFAVSYYSLEHAPTISEFLSSLLIDRKREKETRKTRKRDFENVNTFPLKGVPKNTRRFRRRKKTKKKNEREKTV